MRPSLWLCALVPLLLALPCAQAAKVQKARDVRFVGFARNESASAWRVERHVRQADGSVDSYALVRLISIEKGTLLATFVDAPLVSRDVRGRVQRVPAARLRARNPDFAAAASRAAWLRAKRIGHFAFIAQEFKDTVVRLAADVDTQLEVEAQGKALRVTSKKAAPWGYTAVVRLFEGGMVPLGHYRQERPSPLARPQQATLEVFYNRTGRLVAALNTFFTPNGESHEAVVMVCAPDDPISATGVGLLPVVEAQSRGVYNAFKKLHPDQIQSYRKYIGKYF